MTRKVVTKYLDFKSKIKTDSYPRRKRFNIIIDRRISDDKKDDIV